MPEIREYRQIAGVFQDIVASARVLATTDGTEGAAPAVGSLVSGNYFGTLGVRPQSGRLIQPSDDAQRGSGNVAVISDSYWRAHFGASDNVVGRMLRISGYPFTIIGIAPADFRGTSFEYESEFWVPISMQAEATGNPWVVDFPDAHMFDVLAALRPNISLDQAHAAIATHLRAVADRGDEWSADRVAKIEAAPTNLGSYERVRYQIDRIMAVIAAVSVLLFGVVVANLATLLLARWSIRRHEFSVARAIGASGRRLLAQQMIEVAFLIVPAAAAGALLSWVLCQALGSLPLLSNRLSSPMAKDLGVAWLIVIPCVLVIAFQAATSGRVTLANLSREAGRSSGKATARLRRALVSGQVGFALLAACCAYSLARSAWMLERVDIGYNTSDVLVGRVHLWRETGFDPKSIQLYDEFIDRLSRVPGVISVSSAYYAMLTGLEPQAAVSIPGYSFSSSEDSTVAVQTIGRHYFSTLDIRLLAGRDFDAGDTAHVSQPVIINESMATRFFRGRPPLGHKILRDGKPLTVIGVVGDVAAQDVKEAHNPRMYLPVRAAGFAPPQQVIYVRVQQSATAMIPVLARAIREAAPGVPPTSLRTLRADRDERLHPLKALSHLALSTAAICTLLAALGLASLMTFLVSQRRREIGVRMALGADSLGIFLFMVAEAARPTVIGLSLGGFASLIVGRVTTALISLGATSIDLATVVVCVLLVAVATILLACVPCVRASRTSPVAALT